MSSTHILNIVDQAKKLIAASKPVMIIVDGSSQILATNIDLMNGSTHTVFIDDTSKRRWWISGERLVGCMTDKTQ